VYLLQKERMRWEFLIYGYVATGTTYLLFKRYREHKELSKLMQKNDREHIEHEEKMKKFRQEDRMKK